MSGNSTALPDLSRLQAWLSNLLGPQRSFHIAAVQGGASNLIYRIDYNGHRDHEDSPYPAGGRV